MAKKSISWPHALSLESKDHFTLRSEHDLFIGVNWLKLKSGSYFDPINPANERVFARVTEVDVSPARKASTPLQ